MRIELSDTELMLAGQIGAMREMINRAAKRQDYFPHLTESKKRNEMIGVMAEMAFCKWANQYPNLDIAPQSGTTDVIYQGWKCDIKATDLQNGQLIVPVKKKKGSSDVYVLGVIDKNVVDFRGFAVEDEIINEKRIKDLGHGPTYCMTQEEITKFKEDAEQVTSLQSV
jgi:hypothetical protein